MSEFKGCGSPVETLYYFFVTIFGSLISRVKVFKRPAMSVIYQSSQNFGFEGFVMDLVYLWQFLSRISRMDE
jgi:hypothetical protein